MSLLSKAIIEAQLQNESIDIHLFDCIDSTNQFLREFNATHPITLCLAEQQTKGRGRMNRVWHSPYALNLYFSCLYQLKKSPNELAGLSLVVGLTIYKTLRAMGLDHHLSLKWPNDVLYQQQKIAGVLIEFAANAKQIIVGIGMNVNMTSDDNDITQPWISLKKILQQDIDRNALTVHLIKQLLQDLARFEREGFQAFLEDWHNACQSCGKQMTIQHQSTVIQGKMLGVNLDGQLLLACKDGRVLAFRSGEARVCSELVRRGE